MASRFKKHQIEALKLAFGQSEHPTKEKKIELAKTTGLDMEQITSWFSRNRARKRARTSVGDLEQANSELQQALKQIQEKEAKLQRELQESRGRVAELEAENHKLKGRITVLEGDLQFDSILNFSRGFHFP